MDWKKLFDAAGLDPSRWTETASQEIPPYSFDERKAWTGTFAHAPNMPMRIEAAAWKGRPVSFELFGPWRRPARMQPRAPQTTGQRVARVVSPRRNLDRPRGRAVAGREELPRRPRGYARSPPFGGIRADLPVLIRDCAPASCTDSRGAGARHVPDRHWVVRCSGGLGALHGAGTLPAAALAAEPDLVDSSSCRGRARSAGGGTHPGRHCAGRGVYTSSGSQKPGRLAELGSADREPIHDQRPGRSGASGLAALEYDWTGRARAGYFLPLLPASFGAPEYLGGCRRLRCSVWWPQPCRRQIHFPPPF